MDNTIQSLLTHFRGLVCEVGLNLRQRNWIIDDRRTLNGGEYTVFLCKLSLRWRCLRFRR